ncbi:MAG: GNAT family N-acetyltransferase [Candidatus Izemoplasmatales bacterium]|nr:GNAT family N-acetyltransferase [Candidatus Izemoplasmatales bacterium]
MRFRMKETDESDLQNLSKLWNSGEVMKFVGFPDGLNYTEEKAQKWLEMTKKNKNAHHYSMYHKDQFLGEAFYTYTDGEKGIFDIKLTTDARGKNVGYRAVCFLLDQLFHKTPVKVVTCDPHHLNTKAITLYKRCGFVYQHDLDYDGQKHLVMDLNKDTWTTLRLNSIHLEEITKDNYIEAVILKVSPEQTNFIAENVFSLAQSKYEEECIPKAIYANDNMVGFLMYSIKDSEDSLVWIYRLMIGNNYQGCGYGKKAMELIIPYLKSISKENKIRISFEPENEVAKNLYEKVGFISTEIVSGGEIIYEMTW